MTRKHPRNRIVMLFVVRKHLVKTNMNPNLLCLNNNVLIKIFKGVVFISNHTYCGKVMLLQCSLSLQPAVKMNCRLDIFHTVTFIVCAVEARIASGMCNLFINQSNWRTKSIHDPSLFSVGHVGNCSQIFEFFLCFATAHTMYLMYMFNVCCL